MNEQVNDDNPRHDTADVEGSPILTDDEARLSAASDSGAASGAADSAEDDRDDWEGEEPPLEEGVELAPGYRVVEHLNRSNYYDAYDVYSDQRGCSCVAKVPCPNLVSDERTVAALLREGELLQEMTHPHIVRCYEVLTEPRPTLILETLTGQTLAHLIDNSSRRLSVANLSFLGLHLSAAIHYLHQQGLLHLDLKPSNIVAERGMAKVMDLSLARAPGLIKPGVGTRQYLAPEQASGGQTTAATDVWGIGAVLFESSTGRRPFAAYDDESSYDESSHHEAPTREEANVGASANRPVTDSASEDERYEQLERTAEPVRRYRRLPKSLAALIDACLQPEPEKRPTVEELSRKLKGVLANLG